MKAPGPANRLPTGIVTEVVAGQLSASENPSVWQRGKVGNNRWQDIGGASPIPVLPQFLA